MEKLNIKKIQKIMIQNRDTICEKKQPFIDS